jgi:hypothetical protein
MAYIARQFERSKDLAKRYRISLSQIHAWVEEGVLPVIQVGKTFMFDSAACDKALERFERHVRTVGPRPGRRAQ